jgi:hypothetical protein
MFDSYNVLNNEDMSSDHLPIQLIFNHKSEKQIQLENNNPIKKYNLNKANWDELKDNLPVKMPLEINNNVDELNKFVKDSIIMAADISIPIYTNRINKGKVLPKYVLDHIKLRKKVRKKMIKFRLDEDGKIAFKTRYNKLKSIITEESSAINNNEWSLFIQKLGKIPPSQKPFWQRINKIRGKKGAAKIQMLVVNDIYYSTDHEKAEIFSKNLQQTFSPAQETNFDENFKTRVDERVKNHGFSQHNYKTKELFDMKDLNKTIKLLKRNSAPGEDMINNTMLQNTTSEFRKMILQIINLTVN